MSQFTVTKKVIREDADGRDYASLTTLQSGDTTIFQVTDHEDHCGPWVTIDKGIFLDQQDAEKAFEELCTLKKYTVDPYQDSDDNDRNN